MNARTGQPTSASSVAVVSAEAAPPSPIAYACAGCGYRAAGDRPVPPRCPMAVPDDDIDHVMTRVLDAARLAFPTGSEANPFIRYRALSHAYHRARSAGWTDAEYVALVERLDGAVAAIDGSGFRVTPFRRQGALSDGLGFSRAGGVWVKDETGDVSGSHKARHLMGTLLELEVDDTLDPVRGAPRRLAIASCGNAALAAAVVAAAARRSLDVYIPADASPAVVARLRELGASITVCDREPGNPGDPTYRRLQAAIDAGSVAFTCQGNLNGFAIEGGLTIGYELATDLAAAGATLDRLFIQVGGGALASSCVQGLAEARLLGASAADPHVHPVQAEAVTPLARAHDRLAHRIDGADATAGDFEWAAHHRSAFMWPWAVEPHSVASGILDDETYDWLAVVRATMASGGWPVTVSEATLLEANDLARSTTGIDVCHTGSAGLAGLVELRRHGRVRPDETVAVIFTGIRRDPAPDAAMDAPKVGGSR